MLSIDSDIPKPSVEQLSSEIDILRSRLRNEIDHRQQLEKRVAMFETKLNAVFDSKHDDERNTTGIKKVWYFS